ncbi:MAG: hypothetical protein ACLFPQ_03915 [Candidatus Woesearchaeota archaeon]
MRSALSKTILVLFILSVLVITGCTSSGRLELVDLEYPNNFNTITGRVVGMDMVIKNVGENDCIIKKIYSRQFWNKENPGVTGMYEKELNLVLSPEQEYTITLEPYLWDSDYIQSKKKEFAMIVQVENPDTCILENSQVSGTIDIVVEQSPVEQGPGTIIVVDATEP